MGFQADGQVVPRVRIAHEALRRPASPEVRRSLRRTGRALRRAGESRLKCRDLWMS
jgi:hypothetical protein